jgi:UDP-2,4-diacetamido-2,4,6-trideoxy-beta-L-altropyranose hydrolase
VLCVAGANTVMRELVDDAQVELRDVDVSCAPFDAVGGTALGAFAAGAGARWVSIDSYATTAAAQRAVRAWGVHVLVVDDHGIAAPYDCDLHVDQNLGAPPVPPDGGARQSLAGLSYALLRRPFRVAPAVGGRERVVVSFGGNPGPTVAELGADVAAKVAHRAPVDLVLGGASRPAVAEDLPGVLVHEVAAEPWALFAKAAVAVSAAGSTAWELCASATPAVLVAVAENQEPVGRAIARAGAGVYLGRVAEVDAASIAGCVASLLDTPDELDALARRAVSLVDGLGASRVAAQMRAVDLRVRPAEADDVERYFVWANDPSVRAVSFNPTRIEWDDHVRWFGERLDRVDCWMYVIEDEARHPVGQVRFDGDIADDGADAVIGISLDANARGLGLGAPLIIAGMRELSREAPVCVVHAEVRATNNASAQSFRVAGFTHRSRTARTVGDVDTFIYEIER